MLRLSDKSWSWIFWSATLFNFVIGLPLFFAREWTFGLAFTEPASSQLVLDLWADFGFCVLLIGAGYGVVAANIHRNRGLVWLGVFAKLFDVVTLSWRAAAGIAQPLVLIPAAIDAAFVIAFLLFLYRPGRAAAAA